MILHQITIEEFDEAGDAAIKVTAKSLPDLFRGSGLALAKLIYPQGELGSEPERSIPLVVTAPDLEALLVAFLTELIYFFEAENFILTDFTCQSLTEEGQLTLKGEAEGLNLPPQSPDDPYELGLIPKGVSYHLLTVAQKGEKWQGQFVLDG